MECPTTSSLRWVDYQKTHSVASYDYLNISRLPSSSCCSDNQHEAWLERDHGPSEERDTASSSPTIPTEKKGSGKLETVPASCAKRLPTPWDLDAHTRDQTTEMAPRREQEPKWEVEQNQLPCHHGQGRPRHLWHQGG